MACVASKFAEEPTRAGAVVDRSPASIAGARHRQPHLAASFRNRARGYTERFRIAQYPPKPSGTSRLAGCGAVGASGGTPVEDEEVVTYGISKAGLSYE